MKTIITILSTAILSFYSSAQNSMTFNQNDVSAQLQDQGFFFNDMGNGSPAYEWPVGSGAHSIYTASFWFGGVDINGQLALAAQKYFGSGQDYWSGIVGDSALPNASPSQSFWYLTKAEIETHLMNYTSPGYVPISNIANWPAHGNIAEGELYNIAPFVDVDHDGNYNPYQGDFPCIKGDAAVFMILNDGASVHTASTAERIGAEFHLMFYQYSSTPGLESTTFVDIEVVNMLPRELYDFTGSFFIDSDLGNYSDDYVGSDTSRNMIFAYNGDALDEDAGGVTGYGTPPPALGVKLLNHNMDFSTAFTNSGSYPQIDPNNPTAYYNIMRGKWVDGSSMLDGNGNPTNHMYHGEPNDPLAWSEMTEGNPAGDRRMVLSTNLGTLGAGGTTGGALNGRFNMSYAIFNAIGTDYVNSVTELYSMADQIQAFYDSTSAICEGSANLSIDELSSVEFHLFPNPSNGSFSIKLPFAQSDIKVQIVDVAGRVVFEGEYDSTDVVSVELAEGEGVYLVSLEVDGVRSVKRLIQY